MIQAAGTDEALELVADHPFVQLGSEYAVEVFELPGKESEPSGG